jgi:hypothetical protein
MQQTLQPLLQCMILHSLTTQVSVYGKSVFNSVRHRKQVVWDLLYVNVYTHMDSGETWKVSLFLCHASLPISTNWCLCHKVHPTALHFLRLPQIVNWKKQHNNYIYMCVLYVLTPWRRVLLEKLPSFQLVKKFPALYGTRRFITAFTSARHLSLSWASSIQSIPPHHTSWRSSFVFYKYMFIYLFLNTNYIYGMTAETWVKNFGVWHVALRYTVQHGSHIARRPEVTNGFRSFV